MAVTGGSDYPTLDAELREGCHLTVAVSRRAARAQEHPQNAPRGHLPPPCSRPEEPPAESPALGGSADCRGGLRGTRS